jgi:hypothetical protein
MTIRLVQEDSLKISSCFIRIKHVYRNYLYRTKLKLSCESPYLHQFGMFDQPYIFFCSINVSTCNKKKNYIFFYHSIILHIIREIQKFCLVLWFRSCCCFSLFHCSVCIHTKPFPTTVLLTRGLITLFTHYKNV